MNKSLYLINSRGNQYGNAHFKLYNVMWLSKIEQNNHNPNLLSLRKMAYYLTVNPTNKIQ